MTRDADADYRELLFRIKYLEHERDQLRDKHERLYDRVCALEDRTSTLNLRVTDTRNEFARR